MGSEKLGFLPTLQEILLLPLRFLPSEELGDCPAVG